MDFEPCGEKFTQVTDAEEEAKKLYYVRCEGARVSACVGVCVTECVCERERVRDGKLRQR